MPQEPNLDRPARAWSHGTSKNHLVTSLPVDDHATAMCCVQLESPTVAIGERVPSEPAPDDCRGCWQHWKDRLAWRARATAAQELVTA